MSDVCKRCNKRHISFRGASYCKECSEILHDMRICCVCGTGLAVGCCHICKHCLEATVAAGGGVCGPYVIVCVQPAATAYALDLDFVRDAAARKFKVELDGIAVQRAASPLPAPPPPPPPTAGRPYDDEVDDDCDGDDDDSIDDDSIDEDDED